MDEKLIKGEQAYSGGDLPSESPLQRSLRSLPPLLKADKFDSNRGEQRSVEGGVSPPQVSFCPSEARVGFADRAVEGEMRSMSPSNILPNDMKS